MAESLSSTRSGTPIEILDQCHPISREDWRSQRQRIQHLYHQQDQPLRRVIAEMKTRYGFFATERQYKRKITEWHLDKNVKDVEMRAIVLKQKARRQQGKASVFYVRGRLVQPKKIERFRQRKGLSKNFDITIGDQEQAADTADDIVCLSPSSEEQPRPKGLSPAQRHIPGLSSSQCWKPLESTEANAQKPAKGPLELLERSTQPYSEPSIVEWYRGHGSDSESDRSPAIDKTSDARHSKIIGSQSAVWSYADLVRLKVGSAVAEVAEKPKGPVTENIASYSRDIQSVRPNTISIQSLLSTSAANDLPRSEITVYPNDSRMEQMVLDGLAWLSAHAP